MPESLDDIDRRILDLIQSKFPLVPQPYVILAEQAKTCEGDVLERLQRLRDVRIVREISAIFDSVRLGYRSTLATMAVDPARIEEVADIVSAHPCVSHNYERDHRFNLWFTMTVPPDVSVDGEIGNLARTAGADDFLVLPATRRFKIGVDFSLGTRKTDAGQSSTAPLPKEDEELPSFTDREIDAIRALQRDLPLVTRPFESVAAEFGFEEAGLLEQAKRFLDTGIMRRYAAVLRHQHVGYTSNGMGCWAIPPERIDEAGRLGAAERAVSHCYERPAFPPRWPYNFFTMVHAQSDDEVREIIERLRGGLQPTDYIVLFSHREFKKQRVRYFMA